MNTEQRPLSVFVRACAYSIVAGTIPVGWADEAKPQRQVALEEVIVTAQKRVENIQDVPKSVQVSTQEDFKKAGVTDISQLAAVVPQVGTSAPGTSVGSAPPIRGIKTLTGSLGIQSKTGILVDEVAQPTFSTLANNLIDIERIEVFAGPQSTLSGRNAAAGLISFTTRAPSQTSELNINFTRTNDGERRFSGFGTAPLTDTMAFSLSGFNSHVDGQTFSPLEDGGTHIGDSDDKGGRAKLLWTPTDALSATLSTYYIESYSQGGSALASGAGGFVYIAPAATGAIKGLFPLWDGSTFTREIYSPSHSDNMLRDRGVSLHVDYDIDGLGTLTSLTNYQKSSAPGTTSLVGIQALLRSLFGPQDLNQYSTRDTKYFSQEVRLVSEDMDPWTYLVGAIYSHTEGNSTTRRPFFLFGTTDTVNDSDIKSAALFGRATYSISDSDSLTAGLRYQHDKSGYDYSDKVKGIVSAENSGYGYWGAEASFKHDFSQSVNAYVTVARSETGEAYDLENNKAIEDFGRLDPLPSEKVKNIEIGLKSHLFDDRVLVNIDAFWSKFENYQMRVLATDPGKLIPRIQTFSIGKVDTRGVELTAGFQATDALRLDFNAALIDAIIKSYAGAPCYDYQVDACNVGAGGSRTQDLSGTRMPETPRWKYTASADYTVFLPSLPFDGNMGAFYRYQSSMHFDTFNNPHTEQDGYGTLNLYAGLKSHDDMYRVKLFVNNVFDKHYYNNLRQDQLLGQFSGNNPVIVGASDRNAFRYAGISFDMKFK